MAEKSALRLIPGKDALLEYNPTTYAAKTYVERNGLIYKSKVDTSSTFITTEWDLIGDLRDIRVNNIADRNALTGSTPTSGTTGIHIPIIDNSNVLVLHAQGDPAVGSDKFARYNYNATTHTFLLLQVSTGSTSSNVSDYTLLTNKPHIISGITATAGAGLTGGAVLSGNIPPNRVSFTYSHADTSSQANLTGTGYSYTQKLGFDTYGHVTGATQSTWVHPDTSNQNAVTNTGNTFIQTVQLDGAGHVTSLSSGTWVHPDTSSQASVTNTGSTVIQSIQLDGAGHITNIASATVSTGGGGVNFSVNGNSGGAVSMPNSGTLQITGGTNVQTISSLHGSNVGVRINAIPTGANGQVQINAVGSFGVVAGFTFLSNKLTTPNIVISTQPSSGTTSNNFLMLNSTGGTTRFGFNSLANNLSSAPLNAVQYKTTTGFGGHSEWIFVPATRSITLGSRSAGSIGINSFSIGTTNIATGTSSFTQGIGNITYGLYSHAQGSNNVVSGLASHAEGNANVASGAYSHAEGNTTVASGDNSHSIGALTVASGISSHSGGIGVTNKQVYARGRTSFNYSENTSSQTVSHGALADNSFILGGINHNIASGNTRAGILGGNAIKLTGTTYIDTVAVPSLAIFTTPSSGGGDDLITWNANTKKLGKITQGSLFSPAGSNTQIQINQNGRFGTASNFTFITGTSTLSTINATLSGTLALTTIPASGSTTDQILTRNSGTGLIQRIGMGTLAAWPINANQYKTATGFGGDAQWIFDPTNKALTLGSRTANTIGLNSFAIGTTNIASGVTSVAMGTGNIVGGTQAAVFGGNNSVYVNYSFAAGFGNSIIVHGAGGPNIALGQSNSIISNRSISIGYANTVTGDTSIAIGNNNRALGQYSLATGSGTLATGRGSFTGGFNNSVTTTKLPFASGVSSFGFYYTDSNQTIGHGALADYSTILGGLNHNIAVGNTGAAIIGGDSIKLTGNTYANTVAVPSLAIMTTPSAGSTNDILTWSLSTKKITKITQASLITPPAGANTQLQLNQNGRFGSSTNLTFVTGTSTLSTVNAHFSGLVTASTITVSGNLQINGQAWASQGTLTDAATISWNLDVDPNATVTLGSNRTLANPTNMKGGGTYYLIVKQDATGSRTLSYGTAFKWSGGTAPVLTTTVNAIDILTFICDGTNMYGVCTPNLS